MTTRMKSLVAAAGLALAACGASDGAPVGSREEALVIAPGIVKLWPREAVGSDSFGMEVALKGRTLVASAPYPADEGPGHAWVFQGAGDRWREQEKLTAWDAAPSDCFGRALGIGDGFVAVGAPGAAPSGAAYVFVRAGGHWRPERKLAPSTGAPDGFGTALAIDGNVLAVGAPHALGPTGRASGLVYVYRRTLAGWRVDGVLAPSDGADFDGFGRGVAVRNGLIAVGSPWKHRTSESGELLTLAGGVSVFGQTPHGWVEQARLFELEAGEMMGTSLAFAGTAPLALAVGGFGDAYGLHVFERSGDTWSLVVDDERPGSPESDPSGFGHAVGASDGLVVVCAPEAALSAGAAWVYRRTPSGWPAGQVLALSEAHEGDQACDAVAVEGTLAVLGAPYDDGAGVDQGSIYVADLSVVAP